MPNAIPPGLDESRLAMLVEHFYDKMRVDPLLGPVFNPPIDDWDAHKVLMTQGLLTPCHMVAPAVLCPQGKEK
ncbi:MAG: hypothetical protein ACREPK_12420 [Rhodanobacteraceae bacterium]